MIVLIDILAQIFQFIPTRELCNNVVRVNKLFWRAASLPLAWKHCRLHVKNNKHTSLPRIALHLKSLHLSSCDDPVIVNRLISQAPRLEFLKLGYCSVGLHDSIPPRPNLRALQVHGIWTTGLASWINRHSDQLKSVHFILGYNIRTIKYIQEFNWSVTEKMILKLNGNFGCLMHAEIYAPNLRVLTIANYGDMLSEINMPPVATFFHSKSLSRLEQLELRLYRLQCFNFLGPDLQQLQALQRLSLYFHGFFHLDSASFQSIQGLKQLKVLQIYVTDCLKEQTSPETIVYFPPLPNLVEVASDWVFLVAQIAKSNPQIERCTVIEESLQMVAFLDTGLNNLENWDQVFQSLPNLKQVQFKERQLDVFCQELGMHVVDGILNPEQIALLKTQLQLQASEKAKEQSE